MYLDSQERLGPDLVLHSHEAIHPRLGSRNQRFRLRVWIFDGPVGQVFDGFGVFREFSGGPGRSGMVQDKSGRLLKISIFDNFPEV